MSHLPWLSLALAPLLILPTLAASIPPAQGARLSPTAGSFPLYRYTLPNGLRVWCQPRSDSQSVTLALVLRAGGRYESPAQTGISHFVEHMLFTGTAKRSEQEVRETITRRGGTWNGMTGMEDTTYYAQVAAEDYELALDWLADLVFGATLPADKVERERKILFEERFGKYGWLLNRLEAWGFGWDLGREVRKALFPNSSLIQRISGEDESLERITLDDLRAYYTERYTASNAVLVVAGNVEPEQLRARTEAYFGSLTAVPRPASYPKPASGGPGPYHATVRGPLPTEQVSIMVGARTVGQKHPDRWALEVLGSVLTKALKDEVRYKQGWVYSIGAYNMIYEDVGYFVIGTTTAAEHRQAIIDSVEQQLERVRRGEVTEEQVAQAKAELQGGWALDMESTASRAFWLAGWATVLDDDEAVPDYPSAIAAVTPADLTRVVQTYFVPANRYLAVHDPVLTVPSAGRAGAAVLAAGLGAVVTWRVAARRRRRVGRR